METTTDLKGAKLTLVDSTWTVTKVEVCLKVVRLSLISFGGDRTFRTIGLYDKRPKLGDTEPGKAYEYR